MAAARTFFSVCGGRLCQRALQARKSIRLSANAGLCRIPQRDPCRRPAGLHLPDWVRMVQETYETHPLIRQIWATGASPPMRRRWCRILKGRFASTGFSQDGLWRSLAYYTQAVIRCIHFGQGATKRRSGLGAPGSSGPISEAVVSLFPSQKGRIMRLTEVPKSSACLKTHYVFIEKNLALHEHCSRSVADRSPVGFG